MHAFLLTGTNGEELKAKGEELAKKLNAKILEFTIAKIEDTRNLNNLIRLSFNEPTLITCKNIHEATTEALNAFLKNLEEPQENIYFALTSPSTRKVLPTIVSRCQIIKIRNTKYEIRNKEVEKFLEMKTGEKLAQVDKIKDRAGAVEFTENLINALHNQIYSGKAGYKNAAQNAESGIATLKNLKANGNVSLQLTNLVVSLE